MHFEFSLLIERALRQIDSHSLVQSKQATTFSFDPVIDSLLPVFVEDCPEKYGAEVTTNIAFPLTGKINALLPEGEKVESEKVAEEICSRISNSKSQNENYFDTQIGGLGHLNATSTEQFVGEFLKGAFLSNSTALLKPASFVIRDEEKRQESKAEWKELIISWESIERRCRRTRNSDVLELQRKSEQNEKRGFDDLLMLFALLADDTLDVTPYMLGIRGRQNVPWYLRKFLVDADALLKHHPALLSPNFSPEYRELDFPPYLRDAVQRLLFFRSRVVPAFAGNRTDKVVRSTLELTRAFYSYYHRPECRLILEKGSNSLAKDQVLVITKIIYQLVHRLFAALEAASKSFLAKNRVSYYR